MRRLNNAANYSLIGGAFFVISAIGAIFVGPFGGWGTSLIVSLAFASFGYLWWRWPNHTLGFRKSFFSTEGTRLREWSFTDWTFAVFGVAACVVMVGLVVLLAVYLK